MRIRNNKALIKLIIAKSRQVCKTLKSERRKRGRPPKYEDHLIVSTLLIKVLKGLSFRDLELELQDIFPQVPDFTTKGQESLQVMG